MRIKSAARVGGWYAPNTGDNRDTRELEVLIGSGLTAAEFEEMRIHLAPELREAVSGSEDDPEEVRLSAVWPILRARIVRDKVSKVRGLVIYDGETERPGITGADLVGACEGSADPRDVAILDDVAFAIQSASALSEGLRRESSPPCAQSPPVAEGLRLGGAALDAAEHRTDPPSQSPSAGSSEGATA